MKPKLYEQQPKKNYKQKNIKKTVGWSTNKLN